MAIREAIKYWQYWLMGNKFVVFCNHKPLRDQNVRSRPDEELGDMMGYLHQFDFEIQRFLHCAISDFDIEKGAESSYKL